ncbi:hypothetical protein [Ekhidna sp.]|uniref:hypothetical protein n=1 Tax=Ekhidna sp. TaxID=2608089 RepID=UPI0032EC1E0F
MLGDTFGDKDIINLDCVSVCPKKESYEIKTFTGVIIVMVMVMIVIMRMLSLSLSNAYVLSATVLMMNMRQYLMQQIHTEYAQKRYGRYFSKLLH